MAVPSPHVGYWDGTLVQVKRWVGGKRIDRGKRRGRESADLATRARRRRRGGRGGRGGPVAHTNVNVDAVAVESSSSSVSPDRSSRVVIVGGGWAGLGAALALCESSKVDNAKVDITLIDAIPFLKKDESSGRIGMRRTPSGKPFEAGHRGFWRDYPNIYNLVENYIKDYRNIGAPATELPTDVFTPYTTSAMYGPFGLEATAPVFGEANQSVQLPSPIGQVVATFSNFRRLPLPDLLSFTGLLLAMVDYKRDEETFEKYDRMSAHELFIRFGLSERLVNDFLKPTLLVGLFKSPEELSAAVTMELLYFYALAHQSSFDVRWMASKSINEHMIVPLAEKLQKEFGITIKDGCRVEAIQYDEATSCVNAIQYIESSKKWSGKNNEDLSETINNVDAIVLAVGAKGLAGILKNSPQLARAAPELSSASSLGAIDVISVRLWLDTYVTTTTPANVLSRFKGLRGAGGTYFMLDQLQKEYEFELWNGEGAKGSVVACDFYNAASLCSLSPDAIVDLLMSELLPSAEATFKGVRVIDYHVEKYPSSVSWFSPGSFNKRPKITTRGAENVVSAGDWVRMENREHGSKGLCQERAFVSGIQAANTLIDKGLIEGVTTEHDVIDIRPDEAQYELSFQINKFVRNVLLSAFKLDDSWLR